MTDPVTLAQLVSAAGKLPEVTKSGTVRQFLKVLGLWFAPQKTLRAIDDLADLETRKVQRQALDKASADLLASNPSLVQRHAVRYASESLTRQTNLEAVVSHAYHELTATTVDDAAGDGDDATDDRPDIDEGWRLKFTRYAEDVSDEQMRRVWGKVLAGEISQPGSISLRTMRTIAELDQKTANDFREVSQNLIKDIIRRTDEWSSGVKFDQLQSLAAWGIIDNSVNLQASLVKRNGRYIVVGHKRFLIISAIHGADVLKFPIICLTELGNQLLKLSDIPDETESLTKLAHYLRPQIGEPSFATISRLPGNLDEKFLPAEYIWGEEHVATVNAVIGTLVY